MKDISSYISKLIGSMDKDPKSGMVNALKINSIYASSVGKIWKRPEASNLILDHTNAVYIRKDTTPKKGPYKDKPYIVCDICIDDPLVRSELDTHKELLMLAMTEAGLTFQEMRIIPARRGMRKRHPFSRKPGNQPEQS